eukprot:gb/GEZN01003848.1/.p1 GENE.gb/GEZN01003848.1/~~gb/GEZN01003848.1/.p1  ORF type:complete len:646 (-),score=83.10 gb/GEZN01003848.1/:102-2039(-)
MSLPILAAVFGLAQSCTVLIVTKGASAEGGNMVSQNDDAGGGTVDMRLTPIPAMDWPPGSKRAIYYPNNGYPKLVTMQRGPHFMPKEGERLSMPIGYIPQVAHTYGFWANRYGLVNEKGLALGESTMGARTVGWAVSSGSYGYNLMGIEELSHIALERCATARCALQTMGDLAVEHGFWSEDSGEPNEPGYADSAESLGVCDKDECWVFHILTGPNNASSVWAAQRVPDGHATIIPNAIIIRDMDLSDKENFMASDNILSFAQSEGWWEPGTPFDFNHVYGYRTDKLADATLYALYSGRRLWRAFDIWAPSLHIDATMGQSSCCKTYPFSVQPEYLISLKDMWALMRDYYKGTAYDLSKGIGAGPFNDPVRYDTWGGGVQGAWERGIYIFRNMFSHVAVLRDLPGPLGAVFYYGIDNSLSTAYVPFFAAQTQVHNSYIQVKESVFDENAMFWVFNLVGNYIHLRFDAMIEDVKREQNRLEELGTALVSDLTSKSLAHALQQGGQGETDWAPALRLITSAQLQHTKHVQETWWKLAHLLFAKYSNGWITTGETEDTQDCPGYPAWWLRLSDWAHFPRDGVLPEATKYVKAAASNAFSSNSLLSTSPSSRPLGLVFLFSLCSLLAGLICWQLKHHAVGHRMSYTSLA